MADPLYEVEFNKRLFVAVHAGAGYHSVEKAAEYKNLCKKACLQAMLLLRKKKSAEEAVTAAVSALEDSELSNAGRGSNQTIDGSVECDASVMEGTSSLFGAVGAISGVLNPVQVACHLLQSQQHCSLSLGRVPPSVLVGTGAVSWARQHGFPCSDHRRLITVNSSRLFRKYKRKVERAEKLSGEKKVRYTDDSSLSAKSENHSAYARNLPSLPSLPVSNNSLPHTQNRIHISSGVTSTSQNSSPNSEMGQNSNDCGLDLDKANTKHDILTEKKGVSKAKTECNNMTERSGKVEQDIEEDEVCDLSEEKPAQDTVGAVCVDWEGRLAAAVSSGGIWLKHPGRLGPAAMYGAGCWAQNGDADQPGVAVITSGCGEHVMRTLLAKTCADCLVSVEDTNEGFHTCFHKHFLESRLLTDVDSQLAGAVAVRTTQTAHGVPDVEVCWGHTTESLALGYLRGDGHTPKALISRLTEGSHAGHSFSMSGAFFSHQR